MPNFNVNSARYDLHLRPEQIELRWKAYRAAVDAARQGERKPVRVQP